MRPTHGIRTIKASNLVECEEDTKSKYVWMDRKVLCGNMLFMEREALKPIIPIRLLDGAIRETRELMEEMDEAISIRS